MPSPLLARTRARSQSRLASFLEALSNTFLGFAISALANYLVLPLWGFSPSVEASIQIGIVFTWISLVRSYLLRRLFNYFHTRSV